jgi:superfamily II DNA or RNA helicase
MTGLKHLTKVMEKPPSTCPELFEWQKSHSETLIDSLLVNGYAKDGSDTGTGKTVIALTVARRLGLKPFVICPKAVVPSWTEWAHKFLYSAPHVYNYEKIRTGNTRFYTKNKQTKRAGRWSIDPAKTLLIFDEDHRCKSAKSENAKLMIAAKERGIPTLSLGATSCSNPVEMRALGYLLDMHNDAGWWNWCLKNGCKRGVFGGLTFRGYASVLKRLHDHIYKDGRGSRIRIKDLPPGSFPETLIVADGYDLGVESSKEIDLIYSDLKAELAELEDKKAEDEYNPLTEQLRARQEVELHKVPIFTEQTRDAIESGNSVVIFVNFRATLEALTKRVSGLGEISFIYGAQGDHTRDLEAKKFQKDETRICLCMTQAGGTGLSLHDENGDFPRVSLISPSFSAIDLRQALGRVHRATGKTPSVQKIVFANDTVEMRVCKAVRQKLNNIDLINDDEMNPIL